MLTVQDEQLLGRLLGGNIPDEVRRECAIRTRMFHSSGHSGPMGALGLIDAIRSLGYGPPEPVAVPVKVNWREYPQDGSTKVEAKFFGQWMRGAFLGFVEAGTLAVRMDDDGIVRECRPDMVRLAEVDEPPEEGPDARIELLDVVELDDPVVAPVEETVELVEEADTAEETVDEPVVEDDPPPVEQLAVPKVDPQPGDLVWVEEDDDVKDAIFSAHDEDGAILAMVEGETAIRKIPAGSWTAVGQ